MYFDRIGQKIDNDNYHQTGWKRFFFFMSNNYILFEILIKFGRNKFWGTSWYMVHSMSIKKNLVTSDYI